MTLTLPILETLGKFPNPFRFQFPHLDSGAKNSTYLQVWLWGLEDPVGKLLAYDLILSIINHPLVQTPVLGDRFFGGREAKLVRIILGTIV